MKPTVDDAQIRDLIHNPDQMSFTELTKVLLDTTQGRAWIKLLEKSAVGNKIDGRNPDANAAVYQVAQLAMVRKIKNALGGIIDD